MNTVVDGDLAVDETGPRRPTATTEPGDEIGRYRVLYRLGQGGMGVVFAAHDPDLDRTIALKVLNHRGDAAQARVIREARGLARVDHPNVVPIFDAGRHGELTFIAMELVDGTTLERWLARRQPVDRVIDVFVRAGQGLIAAHQAGLVHRDFKPANVMRARDGRIAVMDFGLVHPTPSTARSEEETTPEEPRASGRAVGTPAYMPPEQHLGLEVDERSDQYAFGVSLFEALYGRLPFEGRTVSDLLQAKLRMDFVATRSRRVPMRIDRVVRRMLRASPEDRFGSLDEALARLQRGPLSVRPALVVSAASAAVLIGMAVPEPPEAPRQCESGTRAIEAVWNPERARAVEQAFAQTGLPYADDTFSRVTRNIDAFTSSWTARYDQVCSAPPSREADLELVCLRSSVAEVDSIVEVLEGGGAKAVDRAASITASLRSVESCRGLDADRPLQGVRMELAGALAHARALDLAGHSERALELAREVELRATDHGAPDLAARAKLLQVRALDHLDRDQSARELAESTYWLAGVEGDDDAAFVAAEHLAHIIGVQGTEPVAAMEWIRHADVALSRAPTARHRAELLQTRGLIAARRGDFRAARADLEEAQAIWIEELDAESTDMATAAEHLGRLAAEQGRFDEAVERLNFAKEIHERISGPDHPVVGDTLGSLGLIHVLHGEYSDALAPLDRAIEIAERAGRGRTRQYANLVNDRAMALQALGRLDEALAGYERALEVRTEVLGPDHPHVAHSIANVGNIHGERGDYEQAVSAWERAHSRLVAGLGPDHPDVGVLESNLGVVLGRLGRHDEARQRMESALRIGEQTLGVDHPELADMLTNLAEVEARQGERGSARQHLQRALEILVSHDFPFGATAEVRLDLVRLDLADGDASRAQQEVRAVLDEASRQSEVSPELWADARALAATLAAG